MQYCCSSSCSRSPAELPRCSISRTAARSRATARSSRGPTCSGRCLALHPHAGTLTLEQVSLSFGGVQAIDGLDLEIRPGQVHGLIGPNGSGKTTTLNVISGYYAPKRGAMQVERRRDAARMGFTGARTCGLREPSRPPASLVPRQCWRTS